LPNFAILIYFDRDTDAFKAYHDGFRNQVAKWPINPLDTIIKFIKSRPADLVVADFGCGEANLAKSVKNKVHSFDLVAADDDLVTQCDMKHVPLSNTSVDIAVFCLSLMGTNAVEFLCEAHRVLRQK
jgi:ribosomal RNA-processing protein 8